VVSLMADWPAERVLSLGVIDGRNIWRADLDALLDYRAQAPGGAQAHPSEEHLLPFYVALGAAGPTAEARRFHVGVDDYVIAMDAYAFWPHRSVSA